MLGGIDFAYVLTRLRSLAGAGGAALVGYIQTGTGVLVRTLRGWMRERVSVLDFIPEELHASIAAGTNTVDLWSYIQAAIDSVYITARGKLYFPAGTYLVGKPLYLWGSSHYYSTSGVTSGVKLIGAGKTATIIEKKTNTVLGDGSAYTADDAVILIARKDLDIADAAYNAGVVGIYVKGTGSGGTKCTWAIYCRGYCAQLEVRNCTLEAKRGYHTTNSMWLSKFSNVHMTCENYGFRMDASGTSNHLENLFVTSTDTIAYLLAGSYSTASGLACDSCSGTAYKCTGEWTINGLGNETFTGTKAIETSGVGVNLIVNTPYVQPYDNAAYVCLTVGASSKLMLKGGQIGTELSPIAIDGQFANIAGGGILETDNVRVRDTYAIADTVTGTKVVRSGGTLTTAVIDLVGILSVTVTAGVTAYFKRSGGDMLRVTAAAAGSGAGIDVVNAAETDYEDLTLAGEVINLQVRTGAGTIGNAIILTNSDISVRRKMYPMKDDGTVNTTAAIYAGAGAPNNANGANGDYYLRGDGTKAGNTLIYHKEGGSWVALNIA